ncbi:PLC-like phosphodiesterase [Spinellus fusiger]|nr:PLC-like phosphodiesterase [Spinellus fusiger]
MNSYCFSFLCYLWIYLSVFSFIHCEQHCNGDVSLCSRSYSNVTYLVTHDSYAVGSNIAATQTLSITDQLNQGVRGLKFSAVAPSSDPAAIHLCHTLCNLLDAGPASKTLDTVAQWLQENPDQVITIMWNNLYDMKATHLAMAYTTSKIAPYIYEHPKDQPWPTLGEMIASGKRVVNFIDSQADEEAVPWLMDQFSFVFETPYDNRNPDTFKCVIDRPTSLKVPDGRMYLINHFLYGNLRLGAMEVQIPQRDQAAMINSESLRNQTMECIQVFDKIPNFIEVDFYEQGYPLEIVAQLNQIDWVKSESLPETTSTLPVPTTIRIQRHHWIPTHIIIDNGAFKSSVQLNLPLFHIGCILLVFTFSGL